MSLLYVDTSVVLRAVLETGTSPELERQLADATNLMTSRLALVESARAILRLRVIGDVNESRLSRIESEASQVWSRCELLELTRDVCDLAMSLVPRSVLRTLDALHLATFVLARRRFEHLELVTADERLRQAALTL